MRETIILSGGGVNYLANEEGDRRGLSGAGLCLGDDVAALDDGDHGPLLDRGWLLEPVGVDAPKKFVADPHLVEARDGLHPGARVEH